MLFIQRITDIALARQDITLLSEVFFELLSWYKDCANQTELFNLRCTLKIIRIELESMRQNKTKNPA
jgi:hypothetical protein